MLQRIEQTKEEAIKHYMSLKKDELAEMLYESNRLNKLAGELKLRKECKHQPNPFGGCDICD